MNLWLIFLTGLTSGGVTCAAMQGGLLVSAIASYKKDFGSESTISTDWLAVASFMVAKFISHVMLGFGLGWLGSTVSLSENARLIFQGIAALFMLVSALNLLEVHKVFRYFSFAPPAFARRLIKGNKSLGSIFAPSILGFLTVLIPCGVTQAMELQAIVSGSPIQGALIMGAFILGTAPMFVLIGLATSKLTDAWRSTFLKIAATLLIGMALYSLNGILLVLDSPYTAQKIGPKIVKLLPPYEKSSTPTTKEITPSTAVESGVQKIKISISNGGYTPTYIKVKKDVPVELILEAGEGVYSCATAFTFRKFKIVDYLKPGESNVHVFTPTEKGVFTFACSMGMYSGTMEVI